MHVQCYDALCAMKMKQSNINHSMENGIRGASDGICVLFLSFDMNFSLCNHLMDTQRGWSNDVKCERLFRKLSYKIRFYYFVRLYLVISLHTLYHNNNNILPISRPYSRGLSLCTQINDRHKIKLPYTNIQLFILFCVRYDS